jgi:hypothetical protein
MTRLFLFANAKHFLIHSSIDSGHSSVSISERPFVERVALMLREYSNTLLLPMSEAYIREQERKLKESEINIHILGCHMISRRWLDHMEDLS